MCFLYRFMASAKRVCIWSCGEGRGYTELAVEATLATPSLGVGSGNTCRGALEESCQGQGWGTGEAEASKAVGVPGELLQREQVKRSQQEHGTAEH